MFTKRAIMHMLKIRMEKTTQEVMFDKRSRKQNYGYPLTIT